MARPIKKFAENVYVNFTAGLALLISSGVEVVRTVEEGAIGAHHGVVVFAIVQILKTLPHFIHGAEEVSKIRD